MEAAGTFETSVDFYQSRSRNKPEDSHVHKDYKLWSSSYVFSAYLSITFRT
jgi:hypothetical protein